MKNSKNKSLILLDGTHYMYRAFHAMPPLSNAGGEATGALYGFLNMLRKLLWEFDPDYLVVVFDAKGKNFRNDLFSGYKANRPRMPDELREQMGPIKEIIAAMGISVLVVPGVEADDVIGTLSTAAKIEALDVWIASGDKDLTQLVGGTVSMINTVDGKILDSDRVKEKFGVFPDRIIDYLSLVGDSVDNVPGVPKVGPKTAVKWLSEYGNLDGVIANASKIKGKVGENLRASLDRLPLSRELVTIKCDVEIDVAPRDLVIGEIETEVLRSFYDRFEFKSWLSELSGEAASEIPGKKNAVAVKYEIITDEIRLDEWIARLTRAPLFSFDTETTSLNYMEAELVGVSFSLAADEAAYVPVGHDYAGAPKQLPVGLVLKKLKSLLENPDHLKVGQNLKYDMSVLARYDIEMCGIRFDTMLESYVLDSTATRHDMNSLARKYLNYDTVKFTDVAGKGAKQITFNKVDLTSAGHYAAEDADITLKLHNTLWPKLEKIPRLSRLFNELEVRLVPVLSRIERNGVMVDADMLRNQSKRLEEKIRSIEEQAWVEAGGEFNLGSPKQIQGILYERLALPILAKTPKGQPSTSEAVLQDLSDNYSLPRLILEYRSMSKLKSTYTDALPTCINCLTGRVHTSYHQAVASTGRLSSSEPNLQNIPIRTPEGRRVRQAFVAPRGYVLLAADYSQIELRIMAHLSQDDGLRNAFAEGKDVHISTASEVFSLNTDSVTADHRRSAKAINFGLIYGMSAFGLAKQLGIDRSAARDYVETYFSRYPKVKKYMESTREQAREQGFVETVFGRRLYVPDITARNAQRRQYAERTAINAPMQGTAADIIKRAMLSLDDWLEKNRVDARIIMQVHDELVLEVHQSEVSDVKEMVRNQMCGAADLTVPLEVEIGEAVNWDEAHI